MSFIIKTVTSLILTLFVSLGVSGMAETSPHEAADDFFAGLTGNDSLTLQLYMDNSYVNFLENVKGSDEDMDRLEKALFRNLSYEIKETAIRGDVAVCKVDITNSDFSNLLAAYEKSSYDYVMKNLYDDKVTDKEKLNSKCLEIYIDEVESTAEKAASQKDACCTREIFLPMEDNGYQGWHIILSDEIMQTVLGGLALPYDSESNEGGDR